MRHSEKQGGHYALVTSSSARNNRPFARPRISGRDRRRNAEDFMGIHKIEIIFHEGGTTKNLDLMLSLFADDATLTSGGKTYKGKDEIRSYWQAAGPFQPQNQWVAYTPAFRIKYAVEGDRLTYTSSASMWIKQRTTLPPTPTRTTL